MARMARKNLETKHTHVMVQGIGKEYIFFDEDCKGYYLTCIQRAQEKINGKVLAFCIMGNHAHILISMDRPRDLGKFMQQINSEYAMYYNRTRKRVGYVFRDRYRSEGITDVNYLLNCVAYIQNNPVKAGIVEKAEDYKYSSLPNYLTGQGIVDFNEASKFFDISSNSMRSIMRELCEGSWMEHDDKEYKDKWDMLKEILEYNNIHNIQTDDALLKNAARKIHEDCGTSYREIANMLEVNRERLRKLMSTPPSP